MLERGFADTMDEILDTCFHEGTCTCTLLIYMYIA